MINPLECFFSIKGHVALNRNTIPAYNTLLFYTEYIEVHIRLATQKTTI